MQTYEFEGKTTEEAIENACRELNVSSDDLDIEVIEPGSAGIFGLVGTRKAKIRVVFPDTEEAYQASGNVDAAATAKQVLESILERIPVEETKVEVGQTDGTSIPLNIEGDKSGLLIGRKGRTLDALQFIVNKIVNRTIDQKTQVVVDSDNYRQRRRDSLIQMALKMGDKAKRTNKPVTTNFLNPHDRRIVHLALRDDEELDTKSRGNGILKKVLIIPKG